MEQFVDAVVIGAGPAGYSAAIRLAQAGLSVACVEREEVGGVCLNFGCIPSKALISVAERYHFASASNSMGLSFGDVSVDMSRVAAHTREIVGHHTSSVEALLGQNGVELVQGRARLAGPTGSGQEQRIIVEGSGGARALVARRAVVLATGVSPRKLPGFEPDERRVRTAKSAVFLEHVPDHLIVLGGGVIGLELGSAYQRLGANLTVVELGSDLLPGIDRDVARVVSKRLEKRGARLLTGTRASAYEGTDDGVRVTIEGPTGQELLEGSEILVAAGFVPHTEGLGLEVAGVKLDRTGHVLTDAGCQTTVPGIYAIGDLSGAPYLAHKAYAEANVLCDSIVKGNGQRDFRAMPAAIFTDPEIVTVGLSETRAKEEEREISVGRFPFSASGRALARGDSSGFVKLIAERGYLIGAAVVGPEASELAAELALAMEVGATLEDLALTVHPHPTLSEAIRDAADHGLGRAVHVANRRSPSRKAS